MESDQQWIISSQIKNYFNDEGLKQEVLFSKLDPGTNQLKLQAEQMNLYNKEGRLILLQEFDYSGSKTTGTQYTFKFDKDGNRIQENVYELDIEHNDWIVKMTTEFLFDHNMELQITAESIKLFDLFGLNEYSDIRNKACNETIENLSISKGETSFVRAIGVFLFKQFLILYFTLFV